jgi:sensor histidine kinase YesM
MAFRRTKAYKPNAYTARTFDEETMKTTLHPKRLSTAQRIWLPPILAMVFNLFVRITTDGSWSKTVINLERPLYLYFLELGFTIVVFYGFFEFSYLLRLVMYKRWSGNLLASAYLLRETKWMFVLIIFAFNVLGLPFTALTDDGLSFHDTFVNNTLGTGFAVIFLLIARGRDYIRLFNQTELDLAEYKQETAAARLQALQSQLNPHFLFNALNTLSSLVHRDADAADEFIQRLAKVYRYVLESAEQETVTLHKELAFLDSYIHLLKTRFKSGLEVNISVQEQFLDWHIPPMTLQILLENAVKHNIVSAHKPLQCSISTTDDALVMVRNTLQKRSEKDASSSVGLANLQARYEFLQNRTGGKKPCVSVTMTEFLVTVPLLE